jgi:O-antigen ligase
MPTNTGTLDRALRVIAGLALTVLAATGTLGLWAWVGVVPLATGLLGWCPAYTLFGIKTCKAA